MLRQVLCVMWSSRCAEGLTLASRAVGWESHPTSQDAEIIPQRWAPIWFGCRGKRYGLERVKRVMNVHVALTFQMGEAEDTQSNGQD